MSSQPSHAELAETCRVVGGAVPLWPYHRARLSAAGCDEELLAQAEAAVREAAQAHSDARPGQRFRLALAVSPANRDVRVSVVRRLSSIDVPSGPVVARVDVAELPVLPTGPAKPVDRSYWDDALGIARAAGAHQAVLVAPDGTIVDGSSASVWIAEGGVLATPPSPPAVPGVARAMVLARAADAGVTTRVEPITWERFVAADEAFLTNAFGGAAAVRGRGGPAFASVSAMFVKVWAGR